MRWPVLSSAQAGGSAGDWVFNARSYRRMGLPRVGAPSTPGGAPPAPHAEPLSIHHVVNPLGPLVVASVSDAIASARVVSEPPRLLMQGCQVAVSYIGTFFTRPITWPSGSAKIPMTTSSMTSISGMITLPPMLAALSRYSVTSSTPT